MNNHFNVLASLYLTPTVPASERSEPVLRGCALAGEEEARLGTALYGSKLFGT